MTPAIPATRPYHSTSPSFPGATWAGATRPQLGYGLGIALGAKLGAPEKLVVNIMGDAAIGMAGMDIETGVRHEIPILTIVLNNHVLSGYAANYPVAADSFAFTNLYGDYADLARSLGAYGERVEDPAPDYSCHRTGAGRYS